VCLVGRDDAEPTFNDRCRANHQLTYWDPVERFPDKIDQLLDALNRVSAFAYADR
jgi:hypothetical protein